jgi:hypothetical protein
MLFDFWSDVRCAIRKLASTPAFSLVVVTTRSEHRGKYNDVQRHQRHPLPTDAGQSPGTISGGLFEYHGVGALDPWTFLGVPSLLVVVALVAILIPVRQAMKIEPAQAL